MQSVVALSKTWTGLRTSSINESFPRTSLGEHSLPWLARRWTDLSFPSLATKPPQPQRFGETSVYMELEYLITWLIAQSLTLRDIESIREYLVEYPALIEVIPQAVQSANRHLSRAQLVLECYRDPEIEDRYLALYVRLESYDDKAVKSIEEAESAFLHHLAGAEGWLQLTTDFSHPVEGE